MTKIDPLLSKILKYEAIQSSWGLKSSELRKEYAEKISKLKKGDFAHIIDKYDNEFYGKIWRVNFDTHDYKSLRKIMDGSINISLEPGEEKDREDVRIGSSHSAIFDSLLTEVDGDLLKVVAWYDNEFGYCSRLVELVKKVG